MPVITLETKIKAKRAIVFDLARNIDLHKVSTEQTNEEAIAGVTSGLIGMGETVTWRARHFGIYQNLTSKITTFEKPISFADEMVKGIFHSMKHQHRFEDKNGYTLLIDIFDYKSPLGFLGRIADRLFLKKYMTNFLKTRNETIKLFAETERWKEVLDENDYSSLM